MGTESPIIIDTLEPMNEKMKEDGKKTKQFERLYLVAQ